MKKIVKNLSFKILLLIGAVLMTALISSKEAAAANNALYEPVTGVQSTYRKSSGYTYPVKDGYVFAGWYADEAGAQPLSSDFTADTAYAKYVAQDVLGVGAQVTTNASFTSTGSVSMRFVTSVDSLNYQKVGFDFVVFDSDNTLTGRESNNVYTKLTAIGGDGSPINYSPKAVFDNASEYFMAYTLTGITNKDFGHGIIAKPYWVTMDGTKVYGVEAVKTVNMSYTPYLTGVTGSKVSGAMNLPTNVLGTSGRITIQGGCTDGTYWYQGYRHNNSTSDYTDDVGCVRKFTINSSGWSANSNSSVYKFYHINDITYNSKLDVLVIVHGLGNRAGISFMDPDTLKVVDPSTLGFADCDSYTIKSATYNGTTSKYLHLLYAENTADSYAPNNEIWSMEYNALRDRYVVGRAERQAMYILDSNFAVIDRIGSSETTKGFTTNCITADDTYIYSALYHSGETTDNLADFDGNVLAIYNWDGDFVANLNLDLDVLKDIYSNATYGIEPEGISVYNNTIYISCADAGIHSTAYACKISSVTLSKDYVATVTENGTTTSYTSLETALFNAGEGSTVTVLEDVEVKSITGIVADNITLTNKAGVDVTISRGFGGALVANDSTGFTIKSNSTGSLTLDGASRKGGSLLKNMEGASMTMKNLTVQNVSGTDTSTINGGVVYNYGDLTVAGCTFTSNTSTGRASILYMESGSTAEISATEFDANSSTAGSGGVIYNMGELSISDSDFSNNSAVNNGGAINCVGGTMNITGCYFGDNSCSDENGGAIAITGGSKATITGTDENYLFEYNFASGTNGGGAIYANDSEITIDGYTFDGNSASSGGAIFANEDGTEVITLKNCTFTFNEANGTYDSSTAPNAGRGGAILNFNQTLNITDCVFGGESLANTAYNMGGALYSGSGATVVLKGSSEETALFAYNSAEDSGGAITIGSGRLEMEGYTFDSNSANSGGAMQFSNGTKSSAQIADCTFVRNESLTGDGGAIRFNVSSENSNKFVVSGCTFGDAVDTGNISAGAGAAVYVNSESTTEISDTTFSYNISTKSGGAIYNKGPLNLTKAEFTGNEGSVGGAINNTSSGTLVADACTFTENHNTATGSDGGGAISITGASTATFTTESGAGSFEGNYSARYGGAIYTNNANVSVTGYTFEGNGIDADGATVTQRGGAVYIGKTAPTSITAETITFKNSTFYANASTSNGGALNNRGRDMDMTGCTMGAKNKGNTSGGAGGAIAADIDGAGTCIVNITNCTVAYNTSTNSAGAVYMKYGTTKGTDIPTFICKGSVFDNNESGSNGGAFNNDGGALTISTCTFSNNYAPDHGGAIYNGSSGTIDINGTNQLSETFTSNSAGDQGGAIRIGSGTVNIYGYKFEGNTAENDGQAIRNSGGTLNIYSSCNFGTNDDVSHGSGTTNNPAS